VTSVSWQKYAYGYINHETLKQFGVEAQITLVNLRQTVLGCVDISA